MKDQKTDYYTIEKKKVIDFLVGFFGAGLVGLMFGFIIYYLFAIPNWRAIQDFVFIFLFFAIPLLLLGAVYLSFQKIETNSRWKYRAFGFLTFVGALFFFFGCSFG